MDWRRIARSNDCYEKNRRINFPRNRFEEPLQFLQRFFSFSPALYIQKELRHTWP